MAVIEFGGKTAHDAVQEAGNLVRWNIPIPENFGRANSFLNPLGPSPARGWIILKRADLDSLNLNDQHNLLFRHVSDNLPGEQIVLNKLVVVKTVNLTPGELDDPDAVHLVEISDRRWLCQNPTYTVSINKQYNVRAPGFAGEFYQDSLNSGSPWTWNDMVSDVWSRLPALGNFPGLTWDPHGSPEGWKFIGVSAWEALNMILKRLGAAMQADLAATTDQYRVVRIGDNDQEFIDLRTAMEGAHRKIYDGEPLTSERSKFPKGVRIFFHRFNVHYGSEETTPKIGTQWATRESAFVQIDGTEANNEAVYHPIWDDLSALADVNGNAINQADLDARAQERSDDFWRMLSNPGGERQHRIYTGVVKFKPGSLVKGVAWRQDNQGGLVTEFVRHPFLIQPDDMARWKELDGWNNSPLQPPDFGPGYPIYPHLLQIVRVTSTVLTPSGFAGFVQQFNPATGAWTDREACWVVDANL